MERESHRRFQNICGSLWGTEAAEKNELLSFLCRSKALRIKLKLQSERNRCIFTKESL